MWPLVVRAAALQGLPIGEDWMNPMVSTRLIALCITDLCYHIRYALSRDLLLGVIAHGAIESGMLRAKYEVGVNDVVSMPKSECISLSLAGEGSWGAFRSPHTHNSTFSVVLIIGNM